MKKALSIIFLAVVLLFFSCKESSPDHRNTGLSTWQMIYKNDQDGQALFGDKSKLIAAVRLGYPVRIGWGSTRVEHVADADFLTIFEGKEVFAQIRTIVGQTPRIDGDSLKIRFRVNNTWTKIAGTNGYSTGLMADHFKDTIVGGGTDRYSSTTWYVLYPNSKQDLEATPLWNEKSPNWGKWEKSSLN